jgi:O-antigen ligase
MNRETLDQWCERGMLGLVLAILVFGPLATGAVRTPDFLVLQGLTLGVLILWTLRFWLNPRPQLLWPPICWAVLAFALYAIVRYRTADIEYVARQEMVRVLVYAFLFLAILNNLHRQEHCRLILFTLIFLAMADSFYAIYQFMTDSDKVWTFVKEYPHRGSGTYICPNHLAGFLEMILPSALAWTLVSRSKPLTKILLGYAGLVILAGIAVTVSRGSWASVAAALVVFFVILAFHRSYRLPSALLLVVMVGAGLYFIPHTRTFKARLDEITANDRFNDSLRFELWAPAVELWKQDVWWGIGPAHFDYRFRSVRPQIVQREPDRVHNDYLNTLVDWGIMGAGLVGSALVLLGVGVLKTWRYVRASPNDLGSKNSNKFALVLGLSVGLLAILVHSVVDFNMQIPANAILAIALMAMLTSCLRFASEKYWVSARLWMKIAASFVLAAGLAYLGRQEIVRATEYAWLSRAAAAPAFSDRQISLLEKAFAIEPSNFETAYSIGEAYRVQSWVGDEDYRDLAGKAMQWFDRATKLDPYHDPSFLRYGMCLDWVGRLKEGQLKFNRAVALDPNGYFTTAHMGWHYVQEEDFAAARLWFERSQRLQDTNNPIAVSYLPIVQRRLLEAATNNYSLSAPGALAP